MLPARASVRSICANNVARVSPENIARAGLDERFENFPVHRPAIHAFAQIRKRGEFSAFVPRLKNRFHGDLAHAFDGGQAEANAFWVGRAVVGPMEAVLEMGATLELISGLRKQLTALCVGYLRTVVSCPPER